MARFASVGLRPKHVRRGGCRIDAALQRIGTDMAKAKLFEEIDQKMREILARSPAADLERNLRALLASAFSRLDLVTREEFDVQREVLARARAKLQALEARLAELEGRIEDRGSRIERD